MAALSNKSDFLRAEKRDGVFSNDLNRAYSNISENYQVMPLRIFAAIPTKDSDPDILHDAEFGDITIHRTRGAYVRLSPRPNGQLVAQLPRWGRRADVLKLLDKSRLRLRRALKRLPRQTDYQDGDLVGKSHHIYFQTGVRSSVHVSGLKIQITLRDDATHTERRQLIQTGIARALREEAKAYLPRRLRFLAMEHGFHYERVRFTHAKSRWGSCSSTGTISLNIALMTVPGELIDYVLLHELNHTCHMDHSAAFWRDLEKLCPGAKQKRDRMRAYSPYI